MAVSEYTKSYNSFSGVDIQATFAGKVIGEVQGVSYSITREKAPIYTMGSPNPRAFSRGKRGIAGSLIFTVFDRNSLLDSIRNLDLNENNVDRFYGYEFERQRFANGRESQDNRLVNDFANLITTGETGEAQSPRQWMVPYYTDQIPPFEIVLTAANEYGHVGSMAVIGCEILNEGCGMSIDDIVTEEHYTFVAREIKHWKPSNNAGVSAGERAVAGENGYVG
ncbi:MAG: hypothetical protein DRN30_06845 [Thermoplasmata archaeon]|nr:MAG: hypothetical protein DRN30_06845 [Thermoplasmata archaeon]